MFLYFTHIDLNSNNLNIKLMRELNFVCLWICSDFVYFVQSVKVPLFDVRLQYIWNWIVWDTFIFAPWLTQSWERKEWNAFLQLQRLSDQLYQEKEILQIGKTNGVLCYTAQGCSSILITQTEQERVLIGCVNDDIASHVLSERTAELMLSETKRWCLISIYINMHTLLLH